MRKFCELHGFIADSEWQPAARRRGVYVHTTEQDPHSLEGWPATKSTNGNKTIYTGDNIATHDPPTLVVPQEHQ
jgi:hypothetical protein